MDVDKLIFYMNYYNIKRNNFMTYEIIMLFSIILVTSFFTAIFLGWLNILINFTMGLITISIFISIELFINSNILPKIILYKTRNSENHFEATITNEIKFNEDNYNQKMTYNDINNINYTNNYC